MTSKHASEPADTTTPIFTQYETFALGGYLADKWGIKHNVVDDIEKGIQTVLNLEQPNDERT